MPLIPDVLQTLRSTEIVLFAVLADQPHEALVTRPAPHEWSVVEVLCHLRDLEREVFPVRTELIRRNDNSLIEGFDQNAWAQERNYAADDPKRAADEFTLCRRKNLLMVEQIGEDELGKKARHSEFGELTLRALLADWAGSDLVHTAQLQRIRLWRYFPELGPFQKYFHSALRMK
jgi:hypothetical protein